MMLASSIGINSSLENLVLILKRQQRQRRQRRRRQQQQRQQRQRQQRPITRLFWREMIATFIGIDFIYLLFKNI